ncbi:hypothetical protein Gorai_001049 [Gossypium raimondii]|uniref:Uncharacterized protein n=1 Tax=Gossypium raimondii TaxID=29730 RepID=A0A7J8PF70_GOSRA|nr:hypothetical protein [Gossypium raimondii]
MENILTQLKKEMASWYNLPRFHSLIRANL